jgi:hypothetical protein
MKRNKKMRNYDFSFFFSAFLLYSIDVKFIFVSLHFFAHFKKQTHTHIFNLNLI